MRNSCAVRMFVNEDAFCKVCFYKSKFSSYHYKGELHMEIFHDCITCASTGKVPVPWSELNK